MAKELGATDIIIGDEVDPVAHINQATNVTVQTSWWSTGNVQ